LIDFENVRSYCLKKKGTITEEFPFDDETLVFKVFGKMFLLANVNVIPLSLNLKCNPERSLELRERYPAVQPAYHMNKRLWNTIEIDGSMPERLVYELIDHSYEEVVQKLPVKLKKNIRGAEGNRI
jgi:predicted DNA-binding protein (MmcQ/YjbR family)